MSLDSLLDSFIEIPSVPRSNLLREPLQSNKNRVSSLGSPGSLKISSLLENAIFTAVGDLPITTDEIETVLDTDDIEAWNNGKTSTKSLVREAIFALAHSEIDQGNIPEYFTKIGICGHCGPVWLWFQGGVSGCPWCRNRAADKPIPRPHPMRCRDCLNFERIDHPHLGHCKKGEPEAPAGLWDDDHHGCSRWLSINRSNGN